MAGRGSLSCKAHIRVMKCGERIHPNEPCQHMPKSAAAPLTATGAPVPLRLLHVVPTYYPAVRYGGPVRSVHALCASLVRRGMEVSVYTTNIDGDGNSEVPLGTPVEMDGVLVHYFPVPVLRRLYWCPALAGQMRRTIAEFDLVHL